MRPQLYIRSFLVGVVLHPRLEYSKKECFVQVLRINPEVHEAWYDLGVQGGGTVGNVKYSAKECYAQALRADAPGQVCAMAVLWFAIFLHP